MVSAQERETHLRKIRIAGQARNGIGAPDKYAGLSKSNYVLACTNHRSRYMPYCPCCGISTSSDLVDHFHPVMGYASLIPDRVVINMSFYCRNCCSSVHYTRYQYYDLSIGEHYKTEAIDHFRSTNGL